MRNNFDNIDQMFCSVLGECLTLKPTSSRNGDMREIVAWQGCLTRPSMSWLTNERRCLSPYYAAAELLWYFSGKADTTMIRRYAPQYEKFTESNGEAYGAYGRRMTQPCNLLNEAKCLLIECPDTRRCVISLWRPTDLVASQSHVDSESGDIVPPKKDVPCTLTMQFLRRDKCLDMIVTMRSQDAWLGLPYDVFAFTCLQHLLAWELDLEIGYYHHQVGSMHLYDKHVEAAHEAMRSAASPQQLWTWPHEVNSSFKSMNDAAKFEPVYRGDISSMHTENITGTMSTSFLFLCERFIKGAQSHDAAVIDPALLKGAELYDQRKLSSDRKSD